MVCVTLKLLLSPFPFHLCSHLLHVCNAANETNETTQFLQCVWEVLSQVWAHAGTNSFSCTPIFSSSPPPLPRALLPSPGSVYSIQSHQSGLCAWHYILSDIIGPTVGHSCCFNQFGPSGLSPEVFCPAPELRGGWPLGMPTSATGIPVLSAPPSQTVNVIKGIVPGA